jgi:hypothetical protein
VAGQVDFTPDEWVTMQRAVTSAGYIVARAEGGTGGDMLSEVLAITQRLSGAGRTHPNQLVRELASMGHVQSGMRPEQKPAVYEEQSLAAIRTATAIIARRSPGDLEAFRKFVVELAEAAARAHKEGGLGGFGGTLVTAAEQAAIGRVKRALGLA